MSVVIVGAGGHAAVIIDILLANGREIVGLTDQHMPAGQLVLGMRVLGTDDQLAALHRGGVTHAIVALGDNRARHTLIERVASLGFELANAIHPSAVVSSSAVIEDGIAIMPNAVVNARARIRRGTIINTGASVDHDCVVGPCAHIAPGARLGGGVRCETDVLVGIGSAVIPGIRIGEGSIVGAGAAVISDVPANTTVVGVPARPRR